MYRSARNIARLIRIARTLARHDALFPLEEIGVAPAALRLARLLAGPGRKAKGRPGERLAQALQALGPTFIKLGQMLSTRPDLLGEQVATDLAALQDRLPPFPGAEARRIVESELGKNTLCRRFGDVVERALGRVPQPARVYEPIPDDVSRKKAA